MTTTKTIKDYFHPVFKALKIGIVGLLGFEEERRRSNNTNERSYLLHPSYNSSSAGSYEFTDSLYCSLIITNFQDELFEIVLKNEELFDLKNGLTWKTFIHVLQKNVRDLKDDQIKYQDSSKDILYVSMMQHRFDLLAVRNQQEIMDKSWNMGVAMAKELEFSADTIKQQETIIDKLKNEIQTTKALSLQQQGGLNDIGGLLMDTRGRAAAKKRKIPLTTGTSLINPTRKRKKPEGAKIV